MYFQQVADQLKNVPLFEADLLYAGADSPQQVQRQLSDWKRAGKIVQLRRGLYAFEGSSEWPHSYAVANHLVKGSYVSLQMALSHYSLIPEHVAEVTSVTLGRPGMWRNQYGRFSFQHIQPAFFFGYHYRQITHTQWAYMATPEKALLDLIYLTPDADNENYIGELRLQNLDQINTRRLAEYVDCANRPKLTRALPHIEQVIEEELTGYRLL